MVNRATSSAPGVRRLADIAWAHSGDKGDSVNLGVVVHDEADYELLLRTVTEQRVLEHFSDICRGTVRRYELPNLNAINLVITQVLDGGPMRSLRMDPQGKTLGDSLLLMPIRGGADSIESIG
ncbi:hypothetical protein BH09PSE5_BH09PSE5_41780 [soil metagenome]